MVVVLTVAACCCLSSPVEVKRSSWRVAAPPSNSHIYTNWRRGGAAHTTTESTTNIYINTTANFNTTTTTAAASIAIPKTKDILLLFPGSSCSGSTPIICPLEHVSSQVYPIIHWGRGRVYLDRWPRLMLKKKKKQQWESLGLDEDSTCCQCQSWVSKSGEAAGGQHHCNWVMSSDDDDDAEIFFFLFPPSTSWRPVTFCSGGPVYTFSTPTGALAHWYHQLGKPVKWHHQLAHCLSDIISL